MKIVWIFLLCSIYAFSQAEINQDIEELDDPDESQYLEQFLAAIFQQIDLETADSVTLKIHGYSQEAVALILTWQDEKKRTENYLLKHLQAQDLKLLTHDLNGESEVTRIHLRQRLQYSPSLKGWRILNKGRIGNQWGSINILTEQDPGENQLTDHAVITVNSYSVPHVEHVILGDFHINWGGGLILNQQGTRLSLTPQSLMRKNLFTMRPHYSSREIDYFHGAAGSFSSGNIQAAAFISDRKARGLVNGDEFKETTSGIHPSGKLFTTHHKKSLGLALASHISRTQFYGAMLLDPDVTPLMIYELGLTSGLSASHTIQVFASSLSLNDSRMRFTWTYSTKPLILAVQYRRYCSDSESPSGSMLTLMGSSASNEEGLSLRAQIRPGRKIHIRYALETATAVKFQSYEDYRSVQLHKIQAVMKLQRDAYQFDFSRKREYSVVEGNAWDGHFTQTKISKGAISLTHYFSPTFTYRVNLKSAYTVSEYALLIQQRISRKQGKWKWAIGHVRYMIPDYKLRLSIYETSVAESFSFFTCYDDGDRWFLYVKQQTLTWFDLELKLAQTRSFDRQAVPKQLAFSFQMSIVL